MIVKGQPEGGTIMSRVNKNDCEGSAGGGNSNE